MVLGLPKGVISGFGKRTLELKDQRRDDRRAAAADRIKRADTLYKRTREQNQDRLKLYPPGEYIPPAILATLPAEHQRAHIAATIGKRREKDQKSEEDIIANMFKNWHNGAVAMQSLDYYKNGNRLEKAAYSALTDPKDKYHPFLLQYGGSARSLLTRNQELVKTKKAKSHRDTIGPDKTSFYGELKGDLGGNFVFPKNVFEQSTLGGKSLTSQAIINGDGILGYIDQKERSSNLAMLKIIDQTLNRDVNLSPQLGTSFRSKLETLIEPLTNRSLNRKDGNQTVTEPPFSRKFIMGAYPQIARFLNEKLNSQQTEDAVRELAQSKQGTPVPKTRVPVGATKVLSLDQKRYRTMIASEPKDNKILLEAFDANGQHAWMQNEANKNKMHTNGLSYRVNLGLQQQYNAVKAAGRNSVAAEKAAKALSDYWYNNVYEGTGSTNDSNLALYRNLVLMEDEKTKHFRAVGETTDGRSLIPKTSIHRTAAKNNPANTDYAKETNKYEAYGLKLAELESDVNSLLEFMIGPAAGRAEQPLDSFFDELAPVDKVTGFRATVDTAIANAAEYGAEFFSYLTGYQGKGRSYDKSMEDKRLKRSLENDGLAEPNKAALRRLSNRMFSIREKFDTLSEIQKRRAIVEFKKLALTYKLSGYVQGDGTGGRTISNQDFEVMLRALWGGPQGAPTVRLQELLTRIKFRRAKTDMVVFTRRQGTYNATLGSNSMTSAMQKVIEGNFVDQLNRRQSKPESSVDIEKIGRGTFGQRGFDVRSDEGLRDMVNSTLPNTFSAVMQKSPVDSVRSFATTFRPTHAEVYSNEANDVNRYAQNLVQNVPNFNLAKLQEGKTTEEYVRNSQDIVDGLHLMTVHLPRMFSNIVKQVALKKEGFTGDEGRQKLDRMYTEVMRHYIPDEEREGDNALETHLILAGIEEPEVYQKIVSDYQNMLIKLYRSVSTRGSIQ